MPKTTAKTASAIAASNRTPLTPEADQYLADSLVEFKAKQQAMKKDWRFEDFERWGFDQISGTFRLEFSDRKELHADGQILGSYSESANTWEWAWHNPYVSPAIARDSLVVKETGAKLGLACTASGMVPAPEEEFITHFCALGLKATDSAGVFRGAAGPVDVLILIKNPRIVEKAAKASRKKAA